MRRRQTALLLVFLLVSGLSFASQTRPSAEVGSVNPDDTTGIGPPITDQDKDGIPDLHEELFSPIRNILHGRYTSNSFIQIMAQTIYLILIETD